jgi:hypothetical protein
MSNHRGAVTLDPVSFPSSVPDRKVAVMPTRRTGRAYLERLTSISTAMVIMTASTATTAPAPHAHQIELSIGLPFTFMDPFGMSVPRKNIGGTRLTAVSHFKTLGIALRFLSTIHPTDNSRHSRPSMFPLSRFKGHPLSASSRHPLNSDPGQSPNRPLHCS